ncbi:hypothetical protein BKA80DRAFT_270616 [Phyllosticta citrichinensis]
MLAAASLHIPHNTTQPSNPQTHSAVFPFASPPSNPNRHCAIGLHHASKARRQLSPRPRMALQVDMARLQKRRRGRSLPRRSRTST